MLGAAGLEHRGQPRDPRQQGRARRQRDRLPAHRHPRPHPGVGPLVHQVVDQPGVAAQRRPPPGRAQVGLGGHRVLAVGQLVGHVGQDLHQGDADVGRGPLGPPGGQQAEPVEQQPPERPVVLGQVVDRGDHRRLRGAALLLPAVELRRALDLERERHLGQQGVEAGGRVVAAGAGDQAQGVAGEVAPVRGADDQDGGGFVEAGHQGGVLAGRQGGGRRHPLDRHHRHPLAAGDGDVGRPQAGRGLEQPHEQGALAEGLRRGVGVGHLDVLDAVGRPGLLDRPQPALVAAGVPHGPLRENVAVVRSSVRSTT